MSDKCKTMDWYDENNPRVLTVKEKAIKDYKEAGYAIDDDASLKRELIDFVAEVEELTGDGDILDALDKILPRTAVKLTDKEGYPVDILWDVDRPYNEPDV